MKLFGRILTGVFILLAICISDSFALSIEPARLELSIPAGRQRGKVVTIDNSDSPDPVHLKIYMEDVVFLPDGTTDYPPAGSTEYSCSKWIKVIPEEIDVPAKRSMNVRVNVAVPEGARGGYYGMLFFETTPTVNNGLGINFRLGGLVDVSVTGTEERKASLANITWDRPNTVEIQVFNEGNVLIRPKGKIKIFDSRNKRVALADFNPQGWGVLPKSSRVLKAQLKESLKSGQYRLRAEIDYGTKYLLGGELQFENQ